MKTASMEKFIKMKDAELYKEAGSLKLAILHQRVDIANHKNKGIHRISEIKKDIARINTVISARKRDKSE